MKMELSKERIVKSLIENDILPSPDMIDSIQTEDELNAVIAKAKQTDAVVLTDDINRMTDASEDINWREFENGRVKKEKGDGGQVYDKFIDYMAESHETMPESSAKGIKIISNYEKSSTKREVQHFVAYFNHRYRALESILKARQELQGLTSISRILAKRDRESVSLIGMVSAVSETKKGNLMLTLEDPTGEIRVVVSKSKPDLYNTAKDTVLDEVVGVTGTNGDKIVFANNVIIPDVPIINKKKKSDDEAYSVFLSDIHVGSNCFLPDELNRFLNWISGDAGSESQKEIASKVKYLFIVGDIVDGVGIYPGQEKELVIPDIYKQYEHAATFLSRIPTRIEVVLCPGNHDAMRIAEPQLKLGTGYSEALAKLSNVTFVSNPALVNMHSSEGFSGFDVLLYHGYSFDHYVANVDSIRTQGGYDRADLIMKFLLQRRHLAPSQGSTLYIPDTEIDPLMIASVPDFFVTGHIHKCSVSNYRGVTLICGSCWQSTTGFQKKVGHHPEPARVPIVNLQTREVKILRF